MPPKQAKSPPHLRPLESKGWKAWLGKKGVIQALFTGAVAILVGSYTDYSTLDTAIDFFRPVREDSYWEGHRNEVKEAFVSSWDAYSKYAWGKL